MKKFYLLIPFLFAFQILPQSVGSLQDEANPVYQNVVDNSDYANLWKKLIDFRRAGDEQNYSITLQQIQNEYPDHFTGQVLEENNSELIPLLSSPIEGASINDNPTWTDEITIHTGNIGVSQGGNPTSFRRLVKSFADTLGNIYVAFTTNWYDNDLLKFYKSTDKGFSWSNIQNITPGGGRKFQGFDVAITDTVGGWKIGMVLVTVPVGGSGYSGRVYYADMNDDGSGYSATLVQAPSGTLGFVSPAIVTDGFSWSPGSTYWYIAYQGVDTVSGAGSLALAALSGNGGTSWTIDTARATYNDYQLDIEYNFRSDTIYVLLTNNLTPTNENLRMRYTSLGSFGTSSNWSQYNPATTSDPEYDATFAVNRGDNSMAVIYTIDVAGNKNIQYSYTASGILPMVSNVDIDATFKTEERAVIHSPETQTSTYRIAYISKAASYDSVLYSSTVNIASGFSSPRVVNILGAASSGLSPSVLGFRSTTTGYSGGVFFAGSGPVNLYFNSSNLVTDVTDLPGTVDKYELAQNYPNPFNPSTVIRFSVPEQANVTLKIFNSIGQQVATLLNGEMSAGNHQVDFNASALSSGIYFYQISSANFTATKKMILIK